MRVVAPAAALALLFLAPLHALQAAEDRPFLTVRWLPLTLPMQLVTHELAHVAIGTAFGWKVTGIDFMADGHLGVTRFSNQSNGFALFAVAVAPRLLDILEMIILSKLHDASNDKDARGFYNALRLSAWMDFEFNTCKTLTPHHHAEPLYFGGPTPKGMTGNDGWDVADGLGLSDGSTRAASAVVAIGVGYIGLHWIF
jgi:hypothetical protein